MDTRKIQYFGDLLFLSPSFSSEEKAKIFKKYTKDEQSLHIWIQIFEEELEKIVNEIILFENKKIAAAREFLQSFDEIKSKWAEKYEKIREIIEKNRLQELKENSPKQNLFDTIF